MFQNFRQSMTWLHTWFGLVLGFVLMVVFFFGSLSVFDREIDRWAIPSSRFEPQPMPSFDQLLRPAFERMQPDAANIEAARSRIDGPMPERFAVVRTWAAYTTHRDPVLGLFAGFELPGAKDPEDAVWGTRTIDPRNGQPLPDDRLKIGSQFFYPLHYSLNLNWMALGTWIVGLAALVMLVALVSGVVMHRKLFRELFTFRPAKSTPRSTLDLHNLTGVVALPFHFMFAFTGLVIFGGIYFPVTHTQLAPLHELHERQEAEATGLPHERAGVAAPLASVDAMVAEAQRRWAARGMAGDVGYLQVQHVGDANAYVSVYRAGTDRVALTGEGIHFKASTGELLREDPPRTAVASVNEFLTGLHLQHFRHWLLRWLYVLGGLSGCACIATGFIFFVEKRKRQHARLGQGGARWVDALAVTTVTGTVIAALGILVANRLLPDQLPAGWPGRGDLEQYAFWGTWALAAAHALWRTAPVAQARLAPAWREQCGAIVVMAVAAVLLNGITTGDHLLRTLAAGYWPVAGVDLALLASALLALVAAHRLKRRAAGAPGRQPALPPEGARA
ncbi:PepSY-associated TM helix domain-containing protein [Aquincola sp. MAHUQ-54]|uniref:PepSY-associated TM helix domain-containing protein n=1 Tax=Aquincola agrisoli TaxID=3119538 RepID=A0AAW9QC04_9BURK